MFECLVTPVACNNCNEEKIIIFVAMALLKERGSFERKDSAALTRRSYDS
jgi:hypothetical protein